MRNLTTMFLAVLFATVTTAASAQERMVLRAPTPPAATTVAAEDEEAPAEHTPIVTVEIQGRIGAGGMWLQASDGSAGLPGAESGHAGDMNFGATLSVRHYGTGLGLTGGYTHAFTGTDTHYGTHGFDVRLSERLTVFSRGNLSVSLLFEAGFVTMMGGAHFACPWELFSFSDSPSTCVAHDTPVGGNGGIGAIGFQVRYRALLAGLEADFRHVDGLGGITSQDDLMVMARVGVAFDL